MGDNLPARLDSQVVSRQGVTLADVNRKMELVYREISIPEDQVYFLSKGRAGVLASVYDLVAREAGISFEAPEIEELTDSYVRLKVRCQYYNPQGLPEQDAAVYEIDVDRLYRIARLRWEPSVSEFYEDDSGNWKKKSEQNIQREKAAALKKLQEQGFLLDEPIYDDEGYVVGVSRRLPPEADVELYKNFQTLRNNKVAKAETCAHRRLVQRFLGQKGVLAGTSGKDWKKNVRMLIPTISPVFDDFEAAETVNELFADDDAREIQQPEETAADDVRREQPRREPTRRAAAATQPGAPRQSAPAQTAGRAANRCSECGTDIPPASAEYSRKTFGRELCYEDQQKAKGGRS